MRIAKAGEVIVRGDSDKATGELIDTETVTISLEGGRWKRAARHLAGGLPYLTSGCASSEGWRVQQEANLPGEKPEPCSSERRGTGNQLSEAARQPHLQDEGEFPGCSASERLGGPESEQPQMPSLQP